MSSPSFLAENATGSINTITFWWIFSVIWPQAEDLGLNNFLLDGNEEKFVFQSDSWSSFLDFIPFFDFVESSQEYGVTSGLPLAFTDHPLSINFVESHIISWVEGNVFLQNVMNELEEEVVK